MIVKKGEIQFLENKFFIIKKGKVMARDIFPNGKVITHECYFLEGEIIGNFFKFLKEDKFKIPQIEIEIEALIDTELEEFTFNQI